VSITASGMYGPTLEKVFIDTAGISIESETLMKVMMMTDTYTPNFDTHDFRDDVTNEVSGTGYTSGGIAITSTEVTFTGGVLTYDSADPSWAGSTITNAMGAAVYYNVGTAATDPLFFLSDFVTAASSSAGTFTIQVSASGWFTLDYTP